MKGPLVRIDNRLVHGQILESWVPYLRASRIIVVNDDVAGDLFRETVIRMAVPREIEVVLRGVEDFAEEQARSGSAAEMPGTIILFASIDDLLKAYRLGFRFSSLNVGNVNNNSGERLAVGNIFLSDKEINDLTILVRHGVKISIQSVPRDRPEHFVEAVEEVMKTAIKKEKDRK